LIFLWQDNNTIINTFFSYDFRISSRNRAKLIDAITVITTVHNIYSPKNIIERDRKRPRVIFTNAKNIRKIFNAKFRRILFILLTINAYNHHINGTDIANQFRKFLTTQRKYNQRIWRFLFH
jgi:hypothetical protein